MKNHSFKNSLIFKSKILILINLLIFVSFSFAETNFKVGIIIPLSGDLADYGIAIKNGFELAKSNTPENFKNIQFIYEDSKYEGKTAVTAFQKLKNQKNTDLYYLWGVSPTEALLPITEVNKIPVIAETTIKEATANGKYIVRAARTGEVIAKALTEELAMRNKKKVLFLNTEIPFYNDILKHMEILLPQKGIAVQHIERILPNETDLKSILARVSKIDFDAIGVFLLPAQLINYYKEAKVLNLTQQAFNADILGSNSLINDCTDNVNGTFLSQVGLTKEFQDLYIKTYKNDSHIGQAAQAYDVAELVAELFGNLQGKLNNDQIIAAITKIAPHSGATGNFIFTDTVDGGKELKMPVEINEILDKKII